MGVIQRVVKAKTRKSKKYLEKREPKLVENTKRCLFLRGNRTSDVIRNFLKDIYAFKKCDSINLNWKKEFLLFEDILPLERLSQKHDASLFIFGSHSKKRPHNLIIGRMYKHHLLDMVELGVENYKGLIDFHNAKVSCGTKPCLLFCGQNFEDNPTYMRVKNLIIDLFRGNDCSTLRLQGFEHALMFLAEDDKILLRSYRILLKKSGVRIPRVELEEIGPSLSFNKKTVKNISMDPFGSKLGRVHMAKQEYGKLQTRKLKALKRKKMEKKNKQSDTVDE